MLGPGATPPRSSDASGRVAAAPGGLGPRRARTRDATVLRAGPAGSGYLPAKRFTGAKNAYGRVALRDPSFFGEVLHRDSVDLDPSQGIGVLRLERLRESGDTTAHLVAEGLARLLRLLDLGSEPGERVVGNLETTVVIDSRVAERSVEPRHDRLAVSQGRELVETTGERLLKDVLRQIAAPHAMLEETQELAMILDENASDLRIRRACFPLDTSLDMPPV